MTAEEVQRLAPTLYMILLSIVVINALAFLSYFLQEKSNKLTKQMLVYWSIQAVALLMAPLFQGGTLMMSIPFSFNIITIYLLREGLFADYARIGSYRKYFVAFFGLAWPLAILLNSVGLNFTIVTLPLAIVTALPAIEMIGLVLFDKQKRFRTIHHKWAALVLSVVAIHCLNFSFFRDEPDSLIWGTTVHILLVVTFGIIISNFHNYMLHKSENERLDRLVKQRTYELNEKLGQVQALKEDNDRLFKVVLHDISNPMSAVIGYLTLLENPALGLSQDQRTNYLSKAILSADSVASTIRQVRALAATEEGQRLHCKEPICLWDAFHIVDTIYTPLYAKKGVVLKIEYPKKDFVFYGNKELFIHSVLGNLLSNSLKFSEGGAKVELKAKVQDGSLIILVKDQGRGIKQEQIPDIFNFKTLSTTRGTAGEPGHGFGLPLMKRYVDQVNGTVEIDSTPKEDGVRNHGTSVRLKFALGNQVGNLQSKPV